MWQEAIFICLSEGFIHKFTNRQRKSWTNEVFWACSLCQIHTHCQLLTEIVLFPRVLMLYWQKYEKHNNHDINSPFDPSSSTRMLAILKLVTKKSKSHQFCEDKLLKQRKRVIIYLVWKFYNRIMH